MLGHGLILLALLADGASLELRLAWAAEGAPPAGVRVEGSEGFVSMQLPEGWEAGDRQTFQLNVDNVAPSVAADNDPVNVNEGDTANNTGTFSDVGDDQSRSQLRLDRYLRSELRVVHGAGRSVRQTDLTTHSS